METRHAAKTTPNAAAHRSEGPSDRDVSGNRYAMISMLLGKSHTTARSGGIRAAPDATTGALGLTAKPHIERKMSHAVLRFSARKSTHATTTATKVIACPNSNVAKFDGKRLPV